MRVCMIHARRPTFNKFLAFAAKLALTFAAFSYVFRDLDTTHLKTILDGQDRLRILEVAILFLVQITLGAMRWRRVLINLKTTNGEGVFLSRLAAFRLYYISVFFGCCLPGGAMSSDVVRVWLSRAYHIPLTLSIHSVVIDRLLALIGLAIVVLAGLPVLAQIMHFDATPFLIGSAILALIGIWFIARIDRVLARFSHLHVVRMLQHFIAGVRELMLRPLLALRLAGYSIFAHITFCVAVYVLARSLGIELTLLQAIVLIPPVILAITLPLSIGGWGVREAGMVGMLSMVGVPAEAALLLGIQVGILAIIISLPASILWFVARRNNKA